MTGSLGSFLREWQLYYQIKMVFYLKSGLFSSQLSHKCLFYTQPFSMQKYLLSAYVPLTHSEYKKKYQGLLIPLFIFTTLPWMLVSEADFFFNCTWQWGIEWPLVQCGPTDLIQVQKPVLPTLPFIQSLQMSKRQGLNIPIKQFWPHGPPEQGLGEPQRPAEHT